LERNPASFKEEFDVVFLLPPRHEFVDLAKSLFVALSEKGFSMISIVTSSAVQNWQEIHDKFTSLEIPYKRLTDFRGKTSLQILLKLKPRLIITDNDLMNIDKTFIFAGKYLNIPTMVIRETISTLNTNVNFLFLSSEVLSKLNQLPRFIRTYMFYIRSIAALEPDKLKNIPKLLVLLMRGYEPGVVGQLADYILANAPEDAETLRKQCPKAKFVRAVGNPRFDETFNSAKSLAIKMELERKFKVPPNKKLLLFLSSSQVEHGIITAKQKIEANEQILLIFKKIRTEFSVIIKLHPVEKNFFPQILTPEYERFVQVTNLNLSELIIASDIVVTWFSTAMINIVIARKPLVVIDFFDERKIGLLPSIQAIADQNAALEANNANQLQESLTLINQNSDIREKLLMSQEAFHATYLNTIDGKSIKRIVDAIKEIIT
jgi:CDP-Glycerol:Poly(glycerophosphate) glycerophosphotransferase